MLNTVRQKHWRKTQLWGLHKTQGGSKLLQSQVLFLQVFQTFGALSSQAAELAARPVIGGQGHVGLPHHGSNITAFSKDRSASQLLRTISAGECHLLCFVFMSVAFLPAVGGRKTIFTIYGPKKWGHAR
jgi:hypothetical protein